MFSLALFPLLISISLFQCSGKLANQVTSPDGSIELEFIRSKGGETGYRILFKNNTVIDTSYLGFYFKSQNPFSSNLSVVNISHSSFDETWETVWGEQRFIHNIYNEMKVELKEKGGGAGMICGIILVLHGVVRLNIF